MLKPILILGILSIISSQSSGFKKKKDIEEEIDLKSLESKDSIITR